MGYKVAEIISLHQQLYCMCVDKTEIRVLIKRLVICVFSEAEWLMMQLFLKPELGLMVLIITYSPVR